MIDISEHGGLFGGSQGSTIKKIQHIETAFVGSAGKSVTIENVNPDNSIILIGGIRGGSNNMSEVGIVASFTSGTQMWVERYSAGSGTSVVITVIEFTKVKSKQTGLFTTTTTSEQTIPIAAVNTAKCLLVVDYKRNSATDYVRIFYGFSSSTSLKVHCSVATGFELAWQVLELP